MESWQSFAAWNITLWWFFDINSVLDAGSTANGCALVDDTDGGAHHTTHIHPLACNQALTAFTFDTPRLWIKWNELSHETVHNYHQLCGPWMAQRHPYCWGIRLRESSDNTCKWAEGCTPETADSGPSALGQFPRSIQWRKPGATCLWILIGKNYERRASGYCFTIPPMSSPYSLMSIPNKDLSFKCFPETLLLAKVGVWTRSVLCGLSTSHTLKCISWTQKGVDAHCLRLSWSEL